MMDAISIESRPVMRRLIMLALIPVLLSCFGCHPAITGGARSDLKFRYEPALLREDLAFLQDAIAKRHPRFHDHAPGTELQQAFTDVERSLQTPMTREEAFRAFALVNPAFKDAHTLLMPTFSTAEGAGHERPFPLAVRLGSGGELLVHGDWVQEGGRDMLRSGSTIRSINGEETNLLLDDLARYGHGETDALRRHMLTVMFPDWLAAIKGWSGTFRLQVENDGQLRTVEITGEAAWKPAQSQHARYLPALHDLGDGIALLRLPTFDVDEDPGTYRTAIDKAFSALRQQRTRKLILDVRGNTGGQSDAGARVIRYLAKHPVNQVSRARERLNEDNRGVFGYKGRAGDMREMDISRDGLIDPAPAAERFNGKVVLLVDAMTYSAGILFATALQDHRLAVLVGQPTGGYANQTGNMEPVHLPNTGLMAYIPARIFVRPDGNASVGPVIPDLAVEPVSNGEDQALKVAIGYLRLSR